MTFDKPVPVKLVKSNDKLKDFPEITENGEEIISINENQYKCILGLRREKVGEEKTEEIEDIPITTPLIDYSELTELCPIGAGKFGSVFKATLRHQVVAVKKLNLDPKTLTPAAFSTFKMEVNVLQFVSFPFSFFLLIEILCSIFFFLFGDLYVNLQFY